MIEFDDFIFAAPPHVGGERFIRICDSAGLKCSTPNDSYVQPVAPNGKLYLSMVRDPFTWLGEYYANATTRHRYSEPKYDPLLAADAINAGSFEKFVALVSQTPNRVGSIFARYKAHTIMRYEDLPWNILEFLESVGVDQLSLDSVPLLEATGPMVFFPREDVPRQRILRSESDLCAQYNYY